MAEQKKPEVGEWCVEHEGGNPMTDKTREDFELWAKNRKMNTSRFTKEFGGEYLHSDMQIAWQAYQQGIADARKASTETAAECPPLQDREQIGRFFDDDSVVVVGWMDTKQVIAIIGSNTATNRAVGDYIAHALRVTPVERTVNP